LEYWEVANKQKANTDDLEECYLKMARIVKDFGDQYLPIFERLHQEMEQRKMQQDMKAIALKLTLINNSPAN
jgi:hypothetical protein